MITLKNIDQYYGSSHTLKDVNLTIREGSCTVLMGRNGVGKTTLMQCITGLVPIRRGDISLGANRTLTKVPAEQRASMGIGYVPQGRQIFPLLTVEENLAIGLRARTDGQRTIPDLIYSLFPVLKEMRTRRGGDLSGGQQQQLAIGRALATQPEVLLLDEPTEGIQPNVVQDIGDIIQKLNKEIGLTVLLVEQKLPFARRVGDHFAIMDRGHVVANGDMSDLLCHQPSLWHLISLCHQPSRTDTKASTAKHPVAVQINGFTSSSTSLSPNCKAACCIDSSASSNFPRSTSGLPRNPSSSLAQRSRWILRSNSSRVAGIRQCCES